MYGNQISETLSAMIPQLPRLAKAGYVHPGPEKDLLFCSNIEGHRKGTVLPFTVLMPTPFLQQSTMLLNMFAKSIVGVLSFPGLTILTNSTASLQTLGILNGIATSIAAMGRACGLFFEGQTFPWSITAG